MIRQLNLLSIGLPLPIQEEEAQATLVRAEGRQVVRTEEARVATGRVAAVERRGVHRPPVTRAPSVRQDTLARKPR
jgi:hypothetical protein